MIDKPESNKDNCNMKCPDCSLEINVCRSRIRVAGEQVCPGCGATLVPIEKLEKKS
jgi:transposase-like protein